MAYRHAATRRGLPSMQGLIVRLPKYQDDPAWEAMLVPEALTIEEFRAALRLWRWQRRMKGQPEGDCPRAHAAGLHAIKPGQTASE